MILYVWISTSPLYSPSLILIGIKNRFSISFWRCSRLFLLTLIRLAPGTWLTNGAYIGQSTKTEHETEEQTTKTQKGQDCLLPGGIRQFWRNGDFESLTFDYGFRFWFQIVALVRILVSSFRASQVAED